MGHLDGRRLHREVLVSAMTSTADAPVVNDRRALHATTAHNTVRVLFGSVLGFMWAGLAIGMLTTLGDAKPHDLLVAFVMTVALWLFSRSVFRPRAIYGSSRGIEYKRMGRWNFVPWKQVGVAEYAAWSWGPFVRIAQFEILDGGATTLSFYASDQGLKEFHRLRQAGIATSDAASASSAKGNV